MLTSREAVARTIRFEGADRLPYDLPGEYGTDFAHVGMTPSPDARPSVGVDEWGAVWENIANGISIYERVHFIRGLENTWIDIHSHPDELAALLDILVKMNLYAVGRYAEAGADGYIFCDDWGLQDRLMISPKSWRALWKPRYARIYAAAHDAGMLTFLHSCGHIVAILEDLIEIGLNVIHMDQQENMGLQVLGERFGGRLTFFSLVDIQQTMAHGTLDEIRTYCRAMGKHLGRPNGGFIPRWYSDPVGAGQRREAIAAMCEEFLVMSKEYGVRSKK